MRAFIAIAPPDVLRLAFAAAQQELAASGADVAWVAPANLHVTLKFLGDITDPQREAVSRALQAIAALTAPFTVEAGGVGAFPSVHAPRVVWVGLKDAQGQLARMAGLIERETRTLAIPSEERSFSAHVTLGRVRSSRGRTALAERLGSGLFRQAAAWPVTSVTLYQSHLSSAGPSYAILADLPLTGR